jgi:hypothetical protein
MTSHIAADEFLAAFNLRQACCRALLELSQRQSALIAQGDYAELLEILQSKQSLIEHLGQLSRDQSPLQTAWPKQRGTFSAEDRKRCETVLAETESLLAALIAEERSSSTRLVSRRDAAQHELQSLSAGRQARQAYHSRPQPTLSRFDLNS